MNFAVYSKDGCPYCEKIKKVLDLTKTKYVVYNLGEQFDKKSFYDEFGEGATFPQVSVNGKKLGGCVDTIEYLKENKIIKV
tara:strand:- start:1088 stop:1330 length:243 start_codon:yes stop_codon:yes gene_type:complete